MRSGRHLLSCAAALLLLAHPTSAETPLSGDQIDKLVRDHTLTITTKNLEEAKGYFASDGTIKGRDGERDFAGTWRTHDNMLCLTIPQFDNEFCRAVVLQADRMLFFTKTGQPAGRVERTQGNPNQF